MSLYPGLIQPKCQISTAETAKTQQLLGIDAYESVLALEAEFSSDFGESPWDLATVKMAELEIVEKM